MQRISPPTPACCAARPVITPRDVVRIETPAERPGKAGRQQIRLFLKYGSTGDKAISGIVRVSRPGRRVYANRDEVPAVLGGLGVAILTTSRGVMTGRAAQQAGVGGEILCNVW